MLPRPPTHKPYTGIGSRDTPEEMLLLQWHMGRVLCDQGWHGFSGLALGSDTKFYQGALASERFTVDSFTNIIPYSGFKSTKECTVRHYHDPSKNIFAFDRLPEQDQMKAYWLGIGARGGTFMLKDLWKLKKREWPAGVALHSRNAMQLLDLDLMTRSRFVHCWATPIGNKGRVKGGTGTAVALALHLGIDVINLATRDGLKRTLKFLETHEADLNYGSYYDKLATMRL